MGNTHLVAIGSTLAAFEMQAAQMWWHVREGEGINEDDFSLQNRVVGVLWINIRDIGLWFAPPEWGSLHCMGHEESWVDPNSFRPETFLDSEQQNIDFEGHDFQLISAEYILVGWQRVW
ncbi:hypothetical protein ACLOJK_002913 [Asimina triloba]